jgi:hypothetical protein
MRVKERIILPKTLTVQLMTPGGHPVSHENILCHLDIFGGEGSYYTYSFIPTNTNGTISLTRQQILDNTELQHCYNASLTLTKEPVEFRFYVMSKDFLSAFIKNIDAYLSADETITLHLFRSQGMPEADLKRASEQIAQKKQFDRTFNEFLKKNNNGLFDYDEVKSKVTGYWTDEIDYKYELIMRP